ncbi:hypothetical protein [Neorhizobium sp. DAR64872/K0K18]|uniref:hypothetical protein n=1 Tax=Neorhizobium sp. DAR64872/K0K18 TaxID=3421958 RepID=UPI003D283A7A
MSEDVSQIFYTCSPCRWAEGERRWKDDDAGFDIFDTYEAAKEDALQLREDIVRQGETEWTPVQIEKLVLAPMNRENLLLLFNSGFEAAVIDHEVLDVID